MWDEPHRLAFNVIEQPASMQELSFHQEVHAPHIDDFFRSTHGEFRLSASQNGSTILEGTTWYKLEIYPHYYRRPISEWLVGRIHVRVLKQIALQSEKKLFNKSAPWLRVDESQESLCGLYKNISDLVDQGIRKVSIA